MRDPDNPNRHLTGAEMKVYRKRLFGEQNGECHWCKGQMALLEACPPSQNVGDVATFEHLEDSFSHDGRNSNPETIVLSCASCNNSRNKVQEERLTKTLKEVYGEEHHTIRRGRSTRQIILLLRGRGINPFA